MLSCQFKKERQYDEVVSEGSKKDWTMNMKSGLHCGILTYFISLDYVILPYILVKIPKLVFRKFFVFFFF